MFRSAAFAAALLVAGAVLVGVVNVQAGEKLKIGAAAPEFKGLPGVDDKSHSLGDYKKDVLVIAITCNHCPVAVAYEDRQIAFAKKFAGKVDFVAINVNNLPADKLDKMKERAKEKGMTYPYLYDETQKIAKSLSARVTPEYYVFNKDRKLVYWGAMDDSNRAAAVKTNYLEEAVQAVLSGEAPKTAKTNARGCSVKYE